MLNNETLYTYNQFEVIRRRFIIDLKERKQIGKSKYKLLEKYADTEILTDLQTLKLDAKK